MSRFRARNEWVKDHQGPLAKAYAVEITRAVDGPDGNRIRTFRITTDNPDRERDVISASGWRLENYQKNPVVLFGHDYKSLPIGKAVAIRQEAHGLSADVEFAPKEIYPFADTVLGLVDFGALKATSVGFDPVKWSLNEERRGYDFQEQELLEFSIVPVPANAEALQLAVKGMGTERFGLYRDWVRDTAAMLAQVETMGGCPMDEKCPMKATAPEGYRDLVDFLTRTGPLTRAEV